MVATFAEVTDLLRDERGCLRGATVRNTLTGETKDVSASVVINASGPWTDSITAMRPRDPEEEDSGDSGRLLRPTKGVHFVVAHDKLPVQNAVVCFHPDDGRVLFAIPWGDSTYVGTTDTDFEGDPSDVHASAEDIDYLLRLMVHYFPEHPLTAADIICTWAGLRPLVRPPGEADEDLDEGAVSREHRVIVGNDKLVTIAGGKLTTYRLIAKEVVDVAVKVLRLSGALDQRLKDPHTDDEPLPGAVHWPEDDDHDAVARQIRDVGGQILTAETARLLADTYGMRGQAVARLARKDPSLAEPLVPGRPEILAQVDFGVSQELCATVVGALKQRTQVFYRDPDQGLGCAARVADRMADLLDWSPQERDRHLADYEAEVADSRRWRLQ